MMNFVHRDVTDATATIQIPGLSAPLKVLHVSDSHVDVGSHGGEKGREEDAQFMNGVYGRGMADRQTGKITKAADALERSLSIGQSNGAAVLCHTGDLVNFPSAAAVAQVDALIDGAGMPLLYTSGNHDWEYGRPKTYQLDEEGAVVASEGSWVFLDADVRASQQFTPPPACLFRGSDPCVRRNTKGVSMGCAWRPKKGRWRLSTEASPAMPGNKTYGPRFMQPIFLSDVEHLIVGCHVRAA
jgi:hypothetical protein